MHASGAGIHGTWRIVGVVLFILILLLVLSGCGAGAPQQEGRDAEDGQAAAGEDTAAAMAASADSAAVTIGSAAAARLAGGLIGPLTTAVQAQGPAGAIDFCSREALVLTAAIEDSIGGGIRLKRATLRPRNPANAPDAMEQAVLEDLHGRELAGDSLPPWVLQHVPGAVRFYRPLRIQALCLNCHGPEDRLDAAVRSALRDRYPGDQAVGYQEGQLRGVIRVEIPASR